MNSTVNTIVVGGGQAGLATSYHLAQQGREHLVLEQSDGPGNAWRNHRWDSFVLNTPNWQTHLPGAEYQGHDPDGFKSRDEFVAYLDQYVKRFSLPIRYCTRVDRMERENVTRNYLVTTQNGTRIAARNVVI